MAINYTFAQAVDIINKNTDTAAIIDITKRFPLSTITIKGLLVKAGEDMAKFASVFPEWMTVRKLESLLAKTGDGATEEVEDTDSEETAEEKPAKKPAKGKKKPEPADEDSDEDAEDDPYAGKSAMELFKECKKRKIKAVPKKTAKFYIDLLKKNDAEQAAAAEDSNDDWGDEEDEKPAKPAKKTEKKPAAKPAKKEEASDDDEDWDI